MDTHEEHRPWGHYEVLSDGPDHKVKRMTVYPGQRLSLQRHKCRAEHWFIVKGRAVVTLNGTDWPLESGRAVDIPAGSAHRVKNTGAENLVFVEVQTGEYFREDDIERLEDDYGRL
jgi:mannose-6-phosphate isomerase